MSVRAEDEYAILHRKIARQRRELRQLNRAIVCLTGACRIGAYENSKMHREVRDLLMRHRPWFSRPASRWPWFGRLIGRYYSGSRPLKEKQPTP